MSKDYYEILMVHPKAEQVVVRAAYYKLSQEYHPDVSKRPDANQRMVDITEAYEVLSDPIRRKQYDLLLSGSSSGARSTSREKPKPEAPRETHTQPYHSDRDAPRRPDPMTFGIDANYLERAVNGAVEW